MTLTIPANAGYLVLARLALSAVCRLTPLGPNEVADLKLAITETSNEFIDDDADDDAADERNLDYVVRLDDESLVIEVTGTRVDPTGESELCRAIIEATVDECEFEPGRTVLTKRLAGA